MLEIMLGEDGSEDKLITLWLGLDSASTSTSSDMFPSKPMMILPYAIPLGFLQGGFLNFLNIVPPTRILGANAYVGVCAMFDQLY